MNLHEPLGLTRKDLSKCLLLDGVDGVFVFLIVRVLVCHKLKEVRQLVDHCCVYLALLEGLERVLDSNRGKVSLFDFLQICNVLWCWIEEH